MNRVISFIEVPGSGITQSFLALNTALALAGQTRSGVLLIDLSFSGAEEIATLLGERPSRTIVDLAALLPHVNENLIRGYLPVHSGVTVLGGVEQGAHGPVTRGQVSDILGIAAAAYPFSLVLTPRDHGAYLESVLDRSDIVLLPLAPHLLCMNQAKKLLDRLKAWHFPMSMVKPFLCKPENVSRPLAAENVREHIGLGPFAEVAYEHETLFSAINTGGPALTSQPRSRFSGDVRKLAKALLDDTLFDGIDRSERTRARSAGTATASAAGPAGSAEENYRRLKEKVHRELIAGLDLKSINLNELADAATRNALREKARSVIQDLLSREEEALSREDRARFVEELLDEVLGLGCLENLLKDPDITEIMVNGHDTIYVEKQGRIQLSDARFTSPRQLATVIDRIVSPVGRRVDESSPLVDARLLDGSRVNIVIPPISLAGYSITIRKFSKKKLAAEDLIRFGALKAPMAEFLRICVRLRKNIIISGGTGSGKTTLLNIVSSFIPEDERIVTIEDSAELKLPQEHVVRLESRPASLEGTGEVSIRRLVINALRMRPDRIVVGECRAGETLDMLQAMNTGHDGSLTTVHANSPRDAVGRIITMVMMAGMELPERAIREQIASAVRVIVQLSRLADGSRKVIDISEVQSTKDGGIELCPLFKYEQTGVVDGKVAGRFVATGTVPRFIDEVETHGLSLDPGIFSKGEIA